MVLFPEIFSNSRTKFERAAGYLITNYNSVSSHLRDHFTSGGTKHITINNLWVSISKILYNLYLRSKDVEKTINEIPAEKLSYYWNTTVGANRIDIWKKLVTKHSKDAVIVFEEGLKQP